MNENEVQKTLKLFDNSIYEVRTVEPPRLNGYFKDKSKLLSEIKKRPNLTYYFCINDISEEAYLKASNKEVLNTAQKGGATNDDDIIKRSWLFIDFDPIRKSKTSATNEQKEKAKQKVKQVWDYLKTKGFKKPILADSGNGYHLIFKIDMENNKENTKILKDFLDTLNKKYNDEYTDIDKSVFNASRITKLYGVMTHKGENTTLTPHRPSKLLDDNLNVEVNDIELFKKVIDENKPQPKTKEVKTPIQSNTYDQNERGLNIMIDDQVKQEIKKHLKDYLEETGRKTEGLFTCVNPSHEDNTPSMSYDEEKEAVHCFSCRESYDIIRLYALDHGFLDKGDGYFIRSCKELVQKYNISTPTYQSNRGTSETPKEDYTKYYNKCKKAINKPNVEGIKYLAERGLTDDLVQKYNIGYDEELKRVIFPLSKNSYIARSTEEHPYIKHFKPKGSNNVIFNNEYIKDSQFNSVVWVNESIIDALSLERVNQDIKAISLNSTNNARQLIQEAKNNNFKGAFILALDTDETGLKASMDLKEDLEAIGIKAYIFNKNSEAYNIKTTFKEIVEKNDRIEEENHYIDLEEEWNKEKYQNREDYLKFRLLGDFSELYQDKIKEKNIVEEAKNIIKEEIGDKPKTDKTQFNFRYDEIVEKQITLLNKDINEWLLSDPNGLKSEVEEFNDTIKNMLEQQALEVYEKENALNYLDEFNEFILDKEKHKAISTGILSLDNALDGGFYKKNLVILGAISSLGKTTLALQLADNMARNGNDVLIFSLEMAKEELIAKTLSRLSYLKAYDHHYTALALSTRDVMTGKGLISDNTPSNQRQQFYNEALDDYKSNIARHVYITECNDTLDISIKTIDEKIKRHIAITNNKPFVVIDYLQIIQDTDKYINDKQKIDKVLSNLKRIARENDIIIFLISSLNRGAYTQEISLDSFKDSGNIEYTADILLGLQLQTDTNINNEENSKKVKEQINKGQQKEDRELTLKVLKNRNGRITDIKGIVFHARYNYMDFKQANDNTTLY